MTLAYHDFICLVLIACFCNFASLLKLCLSLINLIIIN